MFQNHESTSLLPIRVFKAHKEYLTRLLLSPDVRSLATCSADHTVRIWKIDPSEEHLEAIPDAESTDLAMSRTNGSSTSLGGHSQASSSMVSMQSESRSVNGNVRSNALPANTDSFRPISTPIMRRRPLPSDVVLETHQRWVWDCAFSADSAYLVTVCSDHYARLWELQTAQIIRQYNGHHRGAVCVALNDYSEPR
jgi:target of rapamycin complex subunit LST8